MIWHPAKVATPLLAATLLGGMVGGVQVRVAPVPGWAVMASLHLGRGRGHGVAAAVFDGHHRLGG